VPKNYDRRTFIGNGLKTTAGIAALGGTGVLLEACGSTTSNTTIPYQSTLKGGGKPGVGTGKPIIGGTLTIGTEADEAGFDPSSAHYDSTGVMYARTVFDPLAFTLADGTIVPYLAESITPNSDYTEWEITVRPNVKFHDGTPCDGAALLFCMQKFLASSLVNFALNYVSSVAKSGTNSIKIKMHNPWVPFDAWLAGYIGGQIAYMFSPKAFNDKAKPFNFNPVGTGPFVFKEWTPNSRFVATKNPDYWRTDSYGNKLPYVDQVTFLPIPDVSSRFSALRSGTIDLMHTDDPGTILQIRALPSNQYQNVEDDTITVGEPDMSFLMLNTSLAPLNDIRIRQAMAYAFNQKENLQVIGRNVDQPTDGLFPKGNQYNSPTSTGYPTYDLARATSLVNQWKSENGGVAPVLEYSTTPTPSSTNGAAAAAGYFRAAGFTVNLSTVQQANFITDAVLGSYHVFGWRQFANVDPDLNYIFWSAYAAIAHNGIVTNFARNSDPQIQKACDDGRRSADPAVRKQAYKKVNERLAVDLPYIWSGRDVWSVCATSKTKNFNNPTSPKHQVGLGMLSGIVWPTEIWKTT